MWVCLRTGAEYPQPSARSLAERCRDPIFDNKITDARLIRIMRGAIMTFRNFLGSVQRSIS